MRYFCAVHRTDALECQRLPQSGITCSNVCVEIIKVLSWFENVLNESEKCLEHDASLVFVLMYLLQCSNYSSVYTKKSTIYSPWFCYQWKSIFWGLFLHAVRRLIFPAKELHDQLHAFHLSRPLTDELYHIFLLSNSYWPKAVLHVLFFLASRLLFFYNMHGLWVWSPDQQYRDEALPNKLNYANGNNIASASL